MSLIGHALPLSLQIKKLHREAIGLGSLPLGGGVEGTVLGSFLCQTQDSKWDKHGKLLTSKAKGKKKETLK